MKRKFLSIIILSSIVTLIYLSLELIYSLFLEFINAPHPIASNQLFTSQGFPLFANLQGIEIIGYLLGLLIYFLAIIWLIIMIFYSLETIRNNKKFSFNSIKNHIVKRIIPLTYTLGITSVLLILLYFLFIIPGVIFTIFWIFVIPIVLFKNETGFLALKKSTDIVYHNWWNIFLQIIMVLFFIAIVISFLNDIEIIISDIVVFNIVFEFSLLLVISIIKTILYSYTVLFLLELYSHYNKSPDSHEEVAKNYIEQYKNSFSKQAITNALIKEFGDEKEVESYIEKYY